MQWIAASSIPLSSRNDNGVLTAIPYHTLSSRGRKPVAIHCEPVSEETSRTVSIADTMDCRVAHFVLSSQ